MRLHKYHLFAGIYFFINAAGLPLGLTYTALLGPFFYAWLLFAQKREVLLPFLLLSIPFAAAHILFTGVDLSSWCISYLNIAMLYCFIQAVYSFLKTAHDKETVFHRLLILNFILCFVALVCYFTPWKAGFWISQNLTDGVGQFDRLKMFTYEASHYAVVFVPLFFFFGWQYMLRQNRQPGWLLLMMLLLPLLLSFSIGVWAALLAAALVTLVWHGRTLLRRKRIVNSLLNTFFILSVTGLFLLIFFRDNAFFIRLTNIFSGTDTSGQGRTSDAFWLAARIIREKSEWWGIGPGQLKHTGTDIIRAYYLYYENTPVAIPNAAAETLLLFGWTGLAIRMVVLTALFFITRVYRNYFRLSLFVFMFIYQFTGSYITNPAEYVIWVLAFTPAFPVMDAWRYRKQAPQLALRAATASTISASY